MKYTVDTDKKLIELEVDVHIEICDLKVHLSDIEELYPNFKITFV